jgi:hypothetical protein
MTMAVPARALGADRPPSPRALPLGLVLVLVRGRIRAVNAPLVSIGGAGTCDGIFLTGILALLLA